MFNLINSIGETSKIQVRDSLYRVLAKVIYVTEGETQHWYAKIQLENHYVLVISPFDNYMYFGFVGDAMNCTFPTPSTIIYKGELYKKDTDDYQIVKKFVFGDCIAMEGEVRFSDYSCDNKIISLGQISRTGQRADVYAEIVTLDEIKVINS